MAKQKADVEGSTAVPTSPSILNSNAKPAPQNLQLKSERSPAQVTAPKQKPQSPTPVGQSP